MSALSAPTRPTDITPAIAEAIAWRHYGRRARATLIASEMDGIAKLDFAGETALLRVGTGKSAREVELQAAILRHLENDAPALPVARVIAADGKGDVVHFTDGDGHSQVALLTTFLPGRPLAEAGASAMAQANLAGVLATLDRSLAMTDLPSARREILWNVADVSRSRQLTTYIPDRPLRALVEDAFNRWEQSALPVLPTLRHQLIHNDFNPSNILVDEKGRISGIVDFGDALHAPLVCDLATAVAYQVAHDACETLQRMVASFSASVPLTGDELDLIPVLVQARLAMVVAITHWRARLSPANHGYLTRNLPRAVTGLATLAQESGLSVALRLSACLETRDL